MAPSNYVVLTIDLLVVLRGSAAAADVSLAVPCHCIVPLPPTAMQFILGCIPGVGWLSGAASGCCATFRSKATKFRDEQPEVSELIVPCMGQRRLCVPLQEGDVLTWRFVAASP